MTDYIKREDAIEAIENTDWYHFNSQAEMVHGANSDLHQAWYSANDIYSAVENVPSADVAPVRHGRWIEYGENKDGTHNMRCSKCGAGLKSKGHANSYYTKHKYRFCPNCGVKMDLED